MAATDEVRHPVAMNTFHVRPDADEFHVVETYPLGAQMIVVRLPTAAMAEQWLETFLRLRNINGLALWIRNQNV
jgi:hypothetical protein